MCRFLVYKGKDVLLADLLTRPKHSLITQSFQSKERPEPLNGDGFGIGWYIQNDPTPCLFTAITPAWGNRNLHRLAEKIKSHCIFAHLRAATGGLIVSEVNCHPFQQQNLLWMHNGRIRNFDKVKRRMRDSLRDDIYNFIQGTTDSEHAFAVFLNQLPENDPNPTLSVLKEAMLKTIELINGWSQEAGVTEPSMFNFAVTDGHNIIVTRYSSSPEEQAPESLYYSCTSQYQCLDEGCKIRLNEGPTNAVLVASEPLTQDRSDWTAVPANHILTISDDLTLTLDPIP